MNPSLVVHHHAEHFPERPALGLLDSVVSYSELRERIRHTAGALARTGVGRLDVVGVLLHNCLDFVELMLASAHLGAIFMPLNWRLSGPELAYILEHAGAKLLVSEDELAPEVERIRQMLTCERFVLVGGEQRDGWDALEALRERSEPVLEAAAVDRDDVHRLMYTSGTTARPKGVMITYGNLDAKNAAHVVELGLHGGDRGLAAGPLYHVGALDLTTTTLLYVGAATHILPRFDAAAVLDAIERHAVTTLWLAPAMVKMVLAEPSLQERDLSSVRLIIDGGEKMPPPLIERVLEAYPNAWFADAYGLTETVSGDTFLDKRHARAKPGSVGKPVIHLDLRVVDERGRPLAAGRTGEIVLRGPKVCTGYWRDPEATAQAFRDGWFHTGDLGLVDDEGFVYVVDRLKDVIITGGENVASPEVERVLYEHPAVAEAAVVARPDERWGEVPIAYVALAEGAEISEEELVDFCRERLAKFKVPKAVRIVDGLPRNPSGKVLKRDLRERERAKAGTGGATTREEEVARWASRS